MTIYIQTPKKELTREEWIEQYRLSEEFSWGIEDDGKGKGKVVNIYNYGKLVMSLSGYEVLEMMGKRFVEEHTKRCNSECNKPHYRWMEGK